MADLKLYFTPDSCARVTLTALEEIGCPFSVDVIEIAKGQNRSPEFLAINPNGKVPTLVIDGRPLTENMAILLALHDMFPDAHLLPDAEGLAAYQQVSDLSFCSSGLHPLVTRLVRPQFFCDLPAGRERVFAIAEELMSAQFARIDDRLEHSRWWYGDEWSIVDAYINWVRFRVGFSDFDVARYAHFTRHAEQCAKRPSARAAQARSDALSSQLR